MRKNASAATVGRRGMFAAAWAAIAGLILSKTTQRVQAIVPLQFENTGGAPDYTNWAGAPTYIASRQDFTHPGPPFAGYAADGNAMTGIAGISGGGTAVASLPCGVYGRQVKFLAGTTVGVLGENIGAIGVLGRSGVGNTVADLGNGVGVQGESGGGTGVRGLIRGARNAIALVGENASSHTGGAPGAGGFGVYGASVNGHGLVGATGTAGGAAVVGAANGVPGAYAAVFYGPVVVTGAFTVVGSKSAAVPHPDGSHRLLYCVESPESWFEDFGNAELDGGSADICIDPNFAAIADLRNYHVFVTMYDQHRTLAVSNRTPSGFRVTSEGTTGKGAFSWRIVAKRRDIAGERLAKVTIPAEPQLPPMSA
jgi:hypothetical protein